MKKPRLLMFALLLCLPCGSLAVAQDATTIEPGYSYRISLAPGQSDYFWDRGLNAGFAAYTLKHVSGDSDFDVLIKDSSKKTLLRSGVNGGQKSELLVLPTSSNGEWRYLEVKNVGSRTATYRLYARKISFAKQLEQAVTVAILQAAINKIFGIESEEGRANASRVTTVFAGLMANKNFASVAKDVVIEEITSKIQNELGLKGFWADVASNFVAGTIGEVYEDYFSQ